MSLKRVVSFPTQENEIADLQAALLWLLPPHLDFVQPRAPDYPTRNDLLKLAKNIGFETSRMGARTGDAVELFKLQFDLATPEQSEMVRQRVDEATRDKLNDFLDAQGAFDPPNARIAQGRVYYAGSGGQPGPVAPNVRVHVFDDSFSPPQVLASTVSDSASGWYEAPFDFTPAQRRWIGVPGASGYAARLELVRGNAKRIAADLVIGAAAGDLPFSVHGVLTRTPGAPGTGGGLVVGSVVGAYFASAPGSALALSLPSDHQGHYSLTGTAPSAAGVFVGVQSADGQWLVQSGSWANAGGDVERNLELPAAGDANWVVTGMVTGAASPSPAVFVRAVDRDLRKEQPLGGAPTNSAGVYWIEFTAAQFQAAESGSPEIIVRAYAYDTAQVPLVESALRWTGGRVTVINLSLPQTAGQTEFERLSAVLKPLLAGQADDGGDLPPFELTGADEAFLAREASLDAAPVHAWAEGARAAHQAALRPAVSTDPTLAEALAEQGWPFFFNVVRALAATGLDDALAHRQEGWDDTQQRSGEAEHRIPLLADGPRAKLLQALQLLRRHSQTDAGVGAGSPLAQALKLSPAALSPAATSSALDIATQQGTGNPDAFLALANTHPGEQAAVFGFVRTLRVLALTGGDAPLTSVLGARMADGHTVQPLAALKTLDWVADLVSAGMSAGDGDAVRGRALGLQTALEQVHTLPALLNRFGDGSVRFTAPGLAGLPAQVAANVAVSQSLLMNDVLAVGDTGVFSPEATVVLKNLGNYVQAGLGLEGGAALIGAGVPGPGFVLSYGRDVLFTLLGDLYPQIHIDRFWDGLRQIGTGAKAFIGDIVVGWRLPWFIGDPVTVPAEVSDKLPTLRGLFGDLDECVCRPCESVLGLPAYLVELLNLLKTVPAPGVQGAGAVPTAQAVLRQRRPDLFTLPLSCDNANQEVQHIQLALEVLERAAAVGATRAAIYPWTLPYDADAAEAAEGLARLGLSQAGLLALRAGAADADIAAATLSITRSQPGGGVAEWELFTAGRSGAALWAAWGLTLTNNGKATVHDPASGRDRTDNPAEALGWASVLCDRAGLSLPELQQVLATRFVRGANNLALSNLDGCKTSQMQLSPRTEDTYDRMHRFVRLWRKLPAWSVPLLDSALLACQATGTQAAAMQLDGEVLQGLAAAERARLAIGLEPAALLALRMPLADVRTGSTAADNLLAQRFAWFPSTAATLSAVLDKLAASLGADSRAVAALIGGTAEDRVPDALNADNLSWLFRHLTLAKAWGLTVPQLLRLQWVTGWPAFEASGAQLTPRAGFERLPSLLRAAQDMTQGGVRIEPSAAALLPANRLQALAGGPGAALLTPVRIEQMLVVVQDALRQASSETPAPLAQRTRTDLAQSLGDAAAELVLSALAAAIDAAGAPLPANLEASALAALTGGPARQLGAILPLFTVGEAQVLLMSHANGASLDSRLTDVAKRFASRRREQALVAAWQAAIGLVAAAVVDLLQGDLTVDPLPNTTAVRPAAPLFLDAAFWQGTPAPALDEATRPELHNWLHRLDRLAAVLKALPDGEGLRAQARLMKALDWRDMLAPRNATAPYTPKWTRWQEVLALQLLAQPGQLTGPAWRDLATRLGDGAGAVTADELAPLSARLQLDAAETKALASLVAAAADRDILRTPTVLRRVLDLAQLLRPARATAAQAATLMNPGRQAEAAQATRQLLAAKLGDTADAALEPMRDRLAAQRRDALVAYLVQIKKLNSADELYEHYLIDPQVAPCFTTTRVLQAVASVQLFVQRILYGLEDGIGAAGELRQRWTWMRNFRVWEANRKVFLFPENWLFPELRDDKSSSFKLLESALSQGELTAEAASEAFALFLDDVAQAGQIVVLGLYEHVQRDASQKRTGRVLYAVGRTVNPPYAYHWRSCQDFGDRFMEWQPWQRIELDIQGDHVMPFVMNGSLHLAWPAIKQGTATGGDTASWEVRMAWSRYDGRSWRRAEFSRDASTLAQAPYRDERGGFTFRLRTLKNAGGEFVAIQAFVARSVLQGSAPAQGLTDQEAALAAFPAGKPPAATLRMSTDSGEQGLDSRLGWPPSDATFQDSALRELDWECWLLLKAGSGTGWLKLTTANAPSQRIELREVGGMETPIPLGSTWIWVSFGSNTLRPTQIRGYGSVPAATWKVYAEFRTAQGRQTQQSGTTLTTARVDSGRQRQDKLVFRLDASQFTAEDLGLQIDGLLSFWADSAFRIDEASQVTIEPTSQFLLAPPDTRPWQNGNRELDPGRTGKAFFLEWIHADGPLYRSTVFQGAGPGRFLALPAGSNRETWEEPAVWHFAENGVGCYVDLAPLPASNDVKFRILPNAIPEARRYAATWRSTGTLGDARLQQGLFGADQLPAPGPKVARDTLVLNGAGQLDKASQAKLAFDARLPNACYNWEVFFHGPLLVADQLSKQQRFEEAERWLRLVFDPTSGDSGTDAQRFLRFQVFKDLHPADNLTRQLTALARAAGNTATSDEVDDVRHLIERWRDLPFRPFLIARRRHLAFLWRTVFAYLDNLLAWADSLYRRDTRESIAEATLLYVLVARILGPRPHEVERNRDRAARTYDGIAGTWDEFSNLWVSTGNRIYGGQFLSRQDALRTGTLTDDGSGTDGSLYFCIPFNDKLYIYWNTVGSRLFNIRNCRNIEGIERQLPLTDPPIDPELLIRATAAGLNLGDVIAGLYARQPNYRYSTLASRAAELAAETRALGATFLGALEKRDGEDLALLRSTHEMAMQQQVQAVRQLQVDEADRNVSALRASRESAAARYMQYQRLLGAQQIAVPAEQETAGDESMLGRVATAGQNGNNGLGLLEQEARQIEYIATAYGWSVASGIAKGIAGGGHIAASIAYAAIVDIPGKILTAVAEGARVTGEVFDAIEKGWQHGASNESLMAGHFRRRDEWAFQNNLALKELRQIDHQILANDIRLQLAKKEKDNHQLAIEQTQAVDEFMRGKYTSRELYGWMVTSLSAVHDAAYRMALDLARQAEAAACRELGVDALNIVRNDYWDSLRSGLLAGERLHQDIKRLELKYLELNRREYEITKHVSLRRLDPLALEMLKSLGQCELDVPEWLFDLDTPGTYMRRLKALSLSVPCVVGPYTGVNCRLTLLRNEVRHSADMRVGYAKVGDNDTRFTLRFGASESIVTSSGRDDSGLFETALRDERYLPFEGAGAISTWRLELPIKTPTFDFSTISDVVLHLRLTARDGGADLRTGAEGIWKPAAGAPPGPTVPVVISCRDEFAADWAKARDSGGALKIKLDRSLLPYWAYALSLPIQRVSLLSLPTADPKDKASYVPQERWPTAAAGSSTLALGSDGTGTADLGAMPNGLDDLLVVLELARAKA